MKKICLVLCLCLIFLCGCGSDGLKEPPGLTLACGGEEYEAVGGSSDWTYVNGLGRGVSTISCGAHLLDYFSGKDPIDTGDCDTVSLRFEAEPDSVEVRCWSDECLGNWEDAPDSSAETVTNGVIQLPESGGWVYQVDAVWNDEGGSHGNASYGFYVKCPEQETEAESGGEDEGLVSAELEVPPVLTVLCDGEEYPASNNGYHWDTDNGDGTMSSVIACGMHVLDIAYAEDGRTIPRSGSESVTLTFSAEPKSVEVRCWSDGYLGDAASYEANFQPVSITDGVITLPGEGGWVFEVTASWGQGCGATYGFYMR